MIKKSIRVFHIILSAVLHPLSFPTIATLMLFVVDPYFSMFENDAKYFILGIVFSMTYLAPLIFMPALYFLGVIQSITLSNRRERTLPLLITGILFYFTYFFLKKFQAIVFLNVFILASAISTMAAIFMSMRWKISLHMIGAGGFLAFVTKQAFVFHQDNFIYFSAVLLVCGILGTSRLALQAHKPNQIFGGFLSGFLIVFTVMGIVFQS